MNERQFQDERFLYGQFPAGDQLRLAHRVGRSASYVSQLLNPNNPRKSAFHQYAELIRACIEEFGPVDGMAKVERMQAYLNAIAESQAVSAKVCPSKVTGELAVETGEAMRAFLNNEGDGCKVRELTDVVVTAKRALAAQVTHIERKPDIQSRGARVKPEARRRAG